MLFFTERLLAFRRTTGSPLVITHIFFVATASQATSISRKTISLKQDSRNMFYQGFRPHLDGAFQERDVGYHSSLGHLSSFPLVTG